MKSRFDTILAFSALLAGLCCGSEGAAATGNIGFSGHVGAAHATYAVAVSGAVAAIPVPAAAGGTLSVTDGQGRQVAFGLLRHREGLAVVVRLGPSSGQRFTVCAGAASCATYVVRQLD